MSFTTEQVCLKSRTVDQKDITSGSITSSSISSGWLLVAVRVYFPPVAFE